MASARIPAGPSGPGHFRGAPVPGGEPWPADPGAPATRQQGYRPARPADSSTISQIVRAETWDKLQWIGLALLGPASHELGVCYGLAEGGWGIIAGLLDLVKMLLLEGLYQQAHRPWSWNPFDSAERLQGEVADYFLHSELETAHCRYRALTDQFRLVVKNPRQFFGGVWDAEVQAYSEKWQRYKWLIGHRTLANEFEAGRIEGEALLEVVLLLATVLDGVGLAIRGAKALAEIPELVRVARTVDSVQQARALLAARRVEGLRAGAGSVEEAEAGVEASASAKSGPPARTWQYQPKQFGRIEPGAVPETPDLESAIHQALARPAPPAPAGWPQMPDDVASTFGADPQPQTFPMGTKLYRVIGADRSAPGRFWSTAPPPATEAEWRAWSAVPDNWNGDGGYVVHTVGDGGLNAWTGPAAPQQVLTDGYVLPGGTQQVWVPEGTLAPDGPPQPTPWNLTGGTH